MSFASMHEILCSQAGSLTPEVFAGQDVQRMVWRALEESGRWHQRHCTLQAPLVVSAVLAMSIYRSLSIVNVFKRVLDAVRGDEDVSLNDVTPEALYHARVRLGAEPLRLLAIDLAGQASPSPSFLGLVPCAMDGVSMLLPDTPENEAEFGRPPASRGATAFPQLKGVALIFTDTHQIRNCVWGRWNLSELAAGETLVKGLGAEDVTFLDRRYTKVDLWFKFLEHGTHIVHRMSASYKPKPTEPLGDGDFLFDAGRWVEIPNDEEPEASKGKRKRQRRKRRWESRKLRLIEYQIGENERVRLITDLLDPVKYPARAIAVGYHLRWEIEICNDETKTHLSTVCHGTQPTTFRSKKPHGIYQEAWGLVATYNLIRGVMVQAGEKHKVPPLEISFVETLEIIRMTWPKLQKCSDRKRGKLHRRMLRDVAECRLDRPRRKRCAPRVVKKKMSNFPVKQKVHRSKRRDFESELRLVDSTIAHNEKSAAA